MRYYLTIIIFTTLLHTKLSAQADLVCTNITLTPTTLTRGDLFSFTFSVKNNGTTNAVTSHAAIYLQDSISNAVYNIADVSVESINAGVQTSNYTFIHPLPYTVSTGKLLVKVVVNSRNEVVESVTTNNTTISTRAFTVSQTIPSVPSTIGTQINLPYPIILMHGFSANDTTWFSFLRDVQRTYGYSYGGSLDFCLNQDGNLATGEITKDFKDRTNLTTLHNGDIYTINFDVDTSGKRYPSTSVESNEAAAVKQGLGISKAIEHVLNITGKDKVILVGHSMGGLASREYLQNPIRWQADGQHHVAKLLTVGTPHGGSNISLTGSSLAGLDEYSEAVRDLRETYYVTSDSGVYLYGGKESLSVMENSYIYSYYNADVNCNGVINETITGINHKPIPLDIAYTAIIGKDDYTGTLCSNCDGVVGTKEADFNNYLPQVQADTLISEGTGTLINPWHLSEPKHTSCIIRGLDEPDTKDKAYKVSTSGYFEGYFSAKNAVAKITTDSDYYKFSVNSNGLLSLGLYNIPIPVAVFKIIDSTSNTVIFSWQSNGKSFLDTTIKGLNPGIYYLNVYGIPDANSWRYPYTVKLKFTTLIPCWGKTITPNDISIVHALVNLSGDSSQTILSDTTGRYLYDVMKVGNYTLTPKKNNDINKTNGVTSLDLALIQSHILGKTKLNSPFKIIAADVNGDGKITTLDLVNMKRLILGLDTTYTNIATNEKRLWAFVDSSYKFPDSTNPFPFKDSISYNGLNTIKNNQTFIGVKLGDVNWDWNPALARKANKFFVRPKGFNKTK